MNLTLCHIRSETGVDPEELSCVWDFPFSRDFQVVVVTVSDVEKKQTRAVCDHTWARVPRPARLVRSLFLFSRQEGADDACHVPRGWRLFRV